MNKTILMKLHFERDEGSRRKPCHLLKRPRKHYWRIAMVVSHYYPDVLYLRCLNCDHLAEVNITELEELLPTDGTLFNEEIK